MSKLFSVLFEGLKDDDLFLSFDADELPKQNVLAFLKTHDGIPPVFKFNLRWTVYTFYWAHSTAAKKVTTSELKEHCFNKNPVCEFLRYLRYIFLHL